MTLLSINVNKIALLRNSRGTNHPNLAKFVLKLIDLGINSITVHPREDERHIRYNDVKELHHLLSNYKDVELNIEGYPSDRFLNLVSKYAPNQVTLVPDSIHQLTSDHGWEIANDMNFLKSSVARLREIPSRISLFCEPLTKDLLLAKELNVDRVEIYTGKYANDFGSEREEETTRTFEASISLLNSIGLKGNAGHDLSLENLNSFLQLGVIEEVSIGHAFTEDCIYLGVDEAVRRYLEITNQLA
ncbi:pyridoxine 5'-phosphate synthase [Pseudobacteriovorax antillogorgiicola]|uniref:Pyridoxine 5'-phosphate synthase n=1 Tax=Pseudobacteriovorax antillogorgiicola TaxID=1513793 RepID=A0A1Y6CJT6_9BACT|nr:pyridoxine 5'-phosphate synthase [Pseudobacteriovorax antillogorgiicola]TCS47895.1 pyridoxine 5'-phosphate synthase [Pseudobacteriovorax antillogorgiicola]SMF57724.1 pyridoxine 5'-phosphate synthase [Pseudobacteriovorax antillogorgiicola]